MSGAGERFLNPDGSVWVPAFPGQRPPFQKGHRLSVGNRGPLKHGANSARLVGPLAAEIEADLKREQLLRYLFEPEFRDLTFAYCRAAAREQLYRQWIDGMESVEDWARAPEGGKASPAEGYLEMSRRELTLAEELGLVPLVRDDVAEKIAKAKTRIALRDQRRAEKKAEADALKLAFWRAQHPEDFDEDGELPNGGR